MRISIAPQPYLSNAPHMRAGYVASWRLHGAFLAGCAFGMVAGMCLIVGAAIILANV